MTSTKPIGGVGLEQYARIAAGCSGLTDAEEIYQAIEKMGLDRVTWNVVTAGWRFRLYSPEIAERYQRLYAAALTRGRDRIDLDKEAYIAATVDSYDGKSLNEIAAGLDLSVEDFHRAGFEWLDRMADDPKLDTEIKLRCQRGLAVRTGEALKETLEWIPGSMVRQRKCNRCGAFKSTPPRTSYVYCDYCGLLFDIDAIVAAQNKAALDPGMVSGALEFVTEPDLIQAFVADDKGQYARIVRWKTELGMKVSPETFSPRIADRSYRAELLDVMADWAVSLRWDRAFVKQLSALEEFEMEAVMAAGRLNTWSARREVLDETGFEQEVDPEDPGASDLSQHGRRRLEEAMLASILDYLQESRAAWRREVEILSEAKILQRHPDELDEPIWLHIHGAEFCRKWLPFVSEKQDIDALLEATGQQGLYVEAPHPDLDDLTCGQCESKLKAPKGAKRKMCESCGSVLDLEQRTVSCTSCGAGISMAYDRTDQTAYACAYCGGHWTL